MLFVALMATLCGARNWVDIADFAAANEDEFAEIVDLPHGAPSRSTANACATAAFEKADARGDGSFRESSESGHDRFERRKVGAETATMVHYVALSKRTSRQLAETARLHWSVENNGHWPPDAVFHEDDARARKNNAPQNLSIIRRIALDMLKAHPDERSTARKMKRAMCSKEFFLQLFAYTR
jgi:predicted transposase YbfD/YdcC